MTDRSDSERDARRARQVLEALRGSTAAGAGEQVALTIAGESFLLPTHAVTALEALLALLAAGRDIAVFPEVIEAVDRPRCADCGEPAVLADPHDAESWVHAPDAKDRADHTALVIGGAVGPRQFGVRG